MHVEPWLKLKKQGIFEGSRRFFPNTNQESRVKIELITQSFDESFNAQSGGTVSKDDGTTIQFAANSIQLADGEIYQGEVKSCYEMALIQHLLIL